MTSACAWARLSARPRSTSRTSRRLRTRARLTCRDPPFEARNELVQERGVGSDLVQTAAGSAFELAGQPARVVGSELRGDAVLVQHVVDDLVQQAEVRGEAPPGRLLSFGHLADGKRAADCGVEQPSGLQRVELDEVGAAGDIEVLAADHAERGAAELARDGRACIREREIESLRKQRVSVENRRRLVEVHVRGGAAAPDRIVVECRQVVVNHPERVDELDGSRRRQELLRPGTGRLPGREAQQRADALAAALQAVAHGVRERAQLGGKGKLREVLLDQLSVLIETAPAERHRRQSRRGLLWSVPPSRHLFARLAPGLLELRLDLPRDVAELGENLDRGFGVLGRFEARSRPFEPLEQVFGAAQCVLGAAHAARSWAIRPSIPFTRRPASSDAYRFASVTASSIATSTGTSPRSSSWIPIRSTLRSRAPRRSADHSSEAAVIRRSSSAARSMTASAVSRANGSISPSYSEASGCPVTSHW